MWSIIWHTFFFDPVYNTLVFFIDAVPGGDVGLAIVFTTILVKAVLLPISLKASHTQRAMKEIEPELNELKEKYKDNREEQARRMMGAYKEAGIKPFSSTLLLFIQIPIIISLYWSVYRGGGVPLPDINVDLLYSFIPQPEVVSIFFLGIVDITARSLPLAALAGITQYISTSFLLPARKKRDKNAPPNFKEDLAHSMHLQMKYVMPVIIFIVAYTISTSIALYFTVSNVAAIVQEYFVKKHREKERA